MQRRYFMQAGSFLIASGRYFLIGIFKELVKINKDSSNFFIPRERMRTVARVKGTQDLFDLSIYNYVYAAFKKHALLYHFGEVQTPLLENLDLFVRSLGTHTDVVSKEMFLIEPRITGDETPERICLRPEITASLVRAFVELMPATPWKVFTHGPCFRYERPQKGRFRQFNQISMEVIGSSSISEDVQLIAMLDRFFHETLSLHNYALHINFLGTRQDRESYLQKLKQFLDSEQAQGICETCKVRREKNILRIFDCKTESCQILYKSAPALIDCLSEESAREWQQLQDELSLLAVSFTVNTRLVRGLDYYNKTVFEFVSNNLGAQNAFCGGGRYDQLAHELGASQDYPSVGAAIGVERLVLLLEQMRDTLPLEQLPKLSVVMPLAPQQNPLALLIADTLRAAGCSVDVLVEGDSIKNMMRKANKMGATYALIIGEDEQSKRSVMVKNMITGAQEEVAQIDIVSHLKA